MAKKTNKRPKFGSKELDEKTNNLQQTKREAPKASRIFYINRQTKLLSFLSGWAELKGQARPNHTTMFFCFFKSKYLKSYSKFIVAHRDSILDQPEKIKQVQLCTRFIFVGLGGIEPPLHEPESCVMPLYHSPRLV